MVERDIAGLDAGLHRASAPAAGRLLRQGEGGVAPASSRQGDRHRPEQQRFDLSDESGHRKRHAHAGDHGRQLSGSNRYAHDTLQLNAFRSGGGRQPAA